MKPSAPRVSICWIAAAALLFNLLLPATLAIGLTWERNTAAGNLCGATADRDHRGKADPGIVVHHCPICTVASAVPPLRPRGLSSAGPIGDTTYPAFQPVLGPNLFRHGPVQARAPPVAV